MTPTLTPSRSIRHEACDEMSLPRQTRYVTCCVHGQRARVEDVYQLNNWEHESGGGIRCESSHPYCFAWCSREQEKSNG